MTYQFNPLIALGLDKVGSGGGGGGNVSGPGSSTDNAIVRFDGTTGTVIQNSNALISDAGTLTLLGGQVSHHVGSAGNYAPTATDFFIGITSTFTNRTVTLPNNSPAGTTYIIKDESGGAAGSNISVLAPTDTIDGAASVNITANYGVLRVYSDGANYFSF